MISFHFIYVYNVKNYGLFKWDSGTLEIFTYWFSLLYFLLKYLLEDTGFLLICLFLFYALEWDSQRKVQILSAFE